MNIFTTIINWFKQLWEPTIQINIVKKLETSMKTEYSPEDLKEFKNVPKQLDIKHLDCRFIAQNSIMKEKASEFLNGEFHNISCLDTKEEIEYMEVKYRNNGWDTRIVKTFPESSFYNLQIRAPKTSQ